MDTLLVLSSQGLGPGIGLLCSYLKQRQAPWCQKGPSISQAGPRGICRFHSPVENRWSEDQALFCFVFYFETVFNAFYMKGRGELAQSPLCANVLFIMRVSEISCEVVEEERRWSVVRDWEYTRYLRVPPAFCLQVPCLLFTKGSHCRHCALLLKSGCGGQGVGPGFWGQCSPCGEKTRREIPSHPPEPELKVQVPQAQFPRSRDGFYTTDFIAFFIIQDCQLEGPLELTNFQISTPSSVSFALYCTASSLASYQDFFTY